LVENDNLPGNPSRESVLDVGNSTNDIIVRHVSFIIVLIDEKEASVIWLSPPDDVKVTIVVGQEYPMLLLRKCEDDGVFCPVANCIYGTQDVMTRRFELPPQLTAGDAFIQQ